MGSTENLIETKTDGPIIPNEPPRPPRDAGKGLTSRFFTDGMMVLGGTVLAYLACYRYERGYTAFFNIPSEFINLGTQNLLIFAGLMLAIVAFTIQFIISLMPFISPLLRFYVRRPDTRRIGLLFLKWAMIGLAVYGYEYMNDFNYKETGEWILIGTILFLLSCDILLLFVPIAFRNDASYLEGYNQLAEDADKGQPRIFENGVPKSFRYVIIVLILYGGIYAIGFVQAKQTAYLTFLSNESQEVIVRRYADTFVIGKFDSVKSTVLPEFRLMKADDIKAQLVVRKIDRLKHFDMKKMPVFSTSNTTPKKVDKHQ